MLELEISESAKIDIEEIFEYTLLYFGESKANEYSRNLFSELKKLSEIQKSAILELIYQKDALLGYLNNM